MLAAAHSSLAATGGAAMTTPIMLSTWSFGRRGHEAAWPALSSGGTSLDAVETACVTIEGDPEIDSVGFGGLPDRDGAVSLDAAVMESPSRCGAVASVHHFLAVTSIARRVMERTPHVMLAGPGAEAFARTEGFEPQPTLSDDARGAWTAWRREGVAPDQGRDRALPPRPVDRHGGRLFDAPDPEGRWRHHDTIATLAIDAAGTLAGACSTSGMPYKVPGRVGDSPIIGHGLYVEPGAGAAVGTGFGELIMGVCGSFLAVEAMRRGASPLDALREVLDRIAGAYELEAEHQVAFIALRPDGGWASAALRDGFRVAVADSSGHRVVGPDQVWE
jgi:isoaspartyl peptidase/L-asparaginase-like protein (Ntn-hydrolase superfamily)